MKKIVQKEANKSIEPYSLLLTLVSCVVALFLSTPASASLVKTTPRGDVDLNGIVNVSDITTLIDTLLYGNYTYWCDVDYNGELNISDLTTLINAISTNSELHSATCSGTLPVVMINTENKWGVISKENYINASLYVIYPDGKTFGSEASPYTLRIRGRGNSTWTNPPKKPYKLKFDEKVGLMGLNKNKDFTLLPDYLDWWGYLQNAVGFELSRKIGLDYTPNQIPVEVVMNGAYIGLYFLTEQIKVGKNRVNITEQEDEETDPEKITGGWLIEIENYPESTSIPIFEHDNRDRQTLYFTSHSPEILSSKQKNYITQFLQATDSAIYCTHPLCNDWEKYIDIESLAKFYIVNEILDNKEAFSGSCWMSKDRGENTRLKFGPVWDFGSSFAAWNPQDSTCFNAFIYDRLPEYANTHWIKGICQHPHFVKKVKSIWYNFYKNEYPSIFSFIDNFIGNIKDAAQADFIRWPNGNSDLLEQRKDMFFVPSLKLKVKWLQEQWKMIDETPYTQDSLEQKATSTKNEKQNIF